MLSESCSGAGLLSTRSVIEQRCCSEVEGELGMVVSVGVAAAVEGTGELRVGRGGMGGGRPRAGSAISTSLIAALK